MTAMLVSVAELSNIFSVLAVLICFCGVILFIMSSLCSDRNMMVLRVHGDDLMFGGSSGVLPHAPRIPQMKMMKVHIPFTFKLHESFRSTYAEIECEVSSQVEYSLQAIWGVSIRELHLALWRPWNALRDASLKGTLLQGHAQYLTPPQARQPHGEHTLRLSLPAPELQLGTPPRLCYPLVIFLTRRDTRDLHPDETVALVNVVHIKDNVCTLPTSILAQYLKQANGQLSCLKQLYLATGNSTSYDDDVSSTGLGPALALAEPCNNTPGSGPGALVASGPGDPSEGSLWNSAGEQLCVVCQYFPLSRALLPCRHTCICASCFGKLERCPMCRSPIKSYFCIRGEEYMPPEKEMNPCKHRQQTPGASHWLHDWNDRLTDFLGFAR
ncbi:cell growth regulator with RING finger domain protein 1-like isoform X3 [Athalia rosae]|uniref:cell growth regulator with RING finger domain protein 1-like isoform X3 n=1 Tax=Athalia rosae TaxID=37344 RepID=UPI000626435D|nr:cell growth regulator with RING finger domain protein 1-like isoform X3 [Athalia rosae]XP_048510494.1 cell growth regulator with RING finger domain protein 1-like isoform X3 [Athalia rosae]XP_048510495.1 cell growth regulator with RING finger domain protein 1-like isoform X3 [Athalia rosae]